MTRTIFSTLLNKFERRLLAKLSTESRRSQSAVIRHLILKEVAQQQTDVSRRRGPDETPHVQRGTARCASRSTRWAGRNGSLRGFVARGLVPYRKLGSRVVFRRSELEQWIENLPGVSLKDAELNRKARGS